VDAVVALACACTRSNLLLALSGNRCDSLPDVASDSDAPDSYASDSDASDRIGIGIGALSVVSDSGQQFGVQQGTTSSLAVGQSIIIQGDRDRDRSRAY